MTKIPAVMIQGTGSYVGKSVLVAGLCRALVRRGIRVAPFKPQNMSNNAAVAGDGEFGGGEIGRAQALQARAARLAPSIHMNPVLLKPETDTGAQVIVQGRRFGTMRATDYGRQKAALLPRVMESFAIVGAGADIVIVEGAGSPAEVNLRAGDIANMGFAEAADVPVILVGDIDRGGVIASLVGTHAVLSAADRARIAGFVVNKLRGDATLFAGGVRVIVERTGWPCLGVVPWFDRARDLPAEDVLSLADREPPVRSSPRKRGPSDQEASRSESLDSRFDGNEPKGQVTIAVPMLSRIANFDDLDPLRMEPGVTIVMVRPSEAIPADAGLVLIPGSKATIADLAFMRRQGWDIDILAHHRRGGHVLGLCAGYQMLGLAIADPDGVEGRAEAVPGLGLLDVETVICGDKATVAVNGRHVATGQTVAGYEIHLGRTTGPDSARPLLDLGGRLDGARSADGLVGGTYVHGLFAADGFRRAWLAGLGAPSLVHYDRAVEAALDALADHLEASIDVDSLLQLAGYPTTSAKTATTSASIAQAPR